MASIVSCPGCQKRLKIGTDKPGGKLRCPACNTPFVLGARTNTGSAGTAEFQAFELFEDSVVTDSFSIEEEAAPSSGRPSSKLPASRPAASLSKSSVPVRPPEAPKPAAPPASSSRQATKPPDERLLPDDLDLLGDGPVRPEPPRSSPRPPAASPAPPPKKPEPAPPDEWKLTLDDSLPQVPDLPPPAPAPDFSLEPVVERRSEPKVKRPPVPPPPKPPAKPTDFFLPADFDPFAAAAPKAAPLPDFNIDEPRLIEDDDDKVVKEFDGIEAGIRTAADGVAIVDEATDEDMLEAEARRQELLENNDRSREGRTRRREQRRTRARKSRIQSDVRGRWAVVHWGLTVELIALAMMVIAAVLAGLSGLLAVVAHGFIGAKLLFGLSAILLALREVVVMIGYGLCIAAPSKNMAWLWATLALIFALASLGGYAVAVIFPPAFLIMPITLISWFFYLIYLKGVAESLKVHYLAEEAMNLMKLLAMMLMGTIAVWVGMAGIMLYIRPSTYEDLGMMGLLLGTCSCVFSVISIIMAAVITYKYFYILTNLRDEIGWRLES